MPACCGLGMPVICCLAVKNIWNQSSSPVLGTCAAQWTNTPAHVFQQGDIFPHSEIESLPSGHVWMDSPPGMSPLICNVMLCRLTIHLAYCTVLHKRLPVCLPSHMSSCLIYPATVAKRTGFTCTCLICLPYILTHFCCLNHNHISCRRKNILPFEENNVVGW